MTNYNEKMVNAKNFEEVEAIVKEYNEKMLDNVECRLDEFAVKKAVEKINLNYEKSFTNSFLLAYETDRKVAFEKLLKNPCFNKITFKINDNATFKVEKKTSIFKFATLEKAYQLSKTTETDKNNKKILNKSVTIFGALRFYGVVDAFIRNMLIQNLSTDTENKIEISKVIIDNEPIFEDDNGKTFSSNSNNALEKQLNVIVKFFGLDVKMLKKDLPILKISAQKIKRDNSTNKSSIAEIKTLKFADIIFSVITSRANNEDIKVFTNDGKEVGKVEEENTTK